jgi:RNA polymerase sigma-70 factor (TIGR02960 family)
VLPDGAWVEPALDRQVLPVGGDPADLAVQKESVRLAFVAALQFLPPRQRAVLLLCEVLAFPAREVAAMLDTTPASVTSALQRARQALDRGPVQPDPDSPEVRRLAARYAAAWEAGDVDAIVAMLAADARYAMPPLPEWYAGHDAIADFLEHGPMRRRWRHLATHANGQLAVGCYMWDDDAGAYAAHVIDVLTLRGDRIAGITAFIDAELFAGFGLPAEVPA